MAGTKATTEEQAQRLRIRLVEALVRRIESGEPVAHEGLREIRETLSDAVKAGETAAEAMKAVQDLTGALTELQSAFAAIEREIGGTRIPRPDSGPIRMG